MMKFNVRKFVHQVRSLTCNGMRGVYNDGEFAFHLEGHRRPTVSVVDSQLVFCLFGEG